LENVDSGDEQEVQAEKEKGRGEKENKQEGELSRRAGILLEAAPTLRPGAV
jgi:hypothetical protein